MEGVPHLPGMSPFPVPVTFNLILKPPIQYHNGNIELLKLTCRKLIGQQATKGLEGFLSRLVPSPSPSLQYGNAGLRSWLAVEQSVCSRLVISDSVLQAMGSWARAGFAESHLSTPFHHVLVFQGQNFARVRSVLLSGYKQAMRNCPWVVEFWTGYVRAQERLGEEHEEIVGRSHKSYHLIFHVPQEL